MKDRQRLNKKDIPIPVMKRNGHTIMWITSYNRLFERFTKLTLMR